MGLRKRLIRWALIALAVPLSARLADGIARRVEVEPRAQSLVTQPAGRGGAPA